MSDLIERLEAELKSVLDPEVGLNIIDLGLVYSLNVDDEGAIHVAMTLTSRGCPVGPLIVEEAENTLKTLNPGKQVYMSLVFDPPWSPERISEEGRAMLQ
ncbi:MAG: metal-sulfur cluster assembly factor [Leptospiraceae bacterium]|nr:metal-sulfur cluster assembly factor [Leptospiraceae bacterium]MCB1303969.1 metal-sulfur cluster assembly factor [Leptospiraceae bacterium]